MVVVDESAMTDTAALAAIHGHVDAAGAKLLLVGDHKQLAAVGAGGGMDLLAAAGSRYELADARRFTADWERAASLRLRAGDESVLRDYHRHGRLLDSGTQDAAETSATTAWLADTLDGRRSLLLVDTNEQAGRLSATLRSELVRLGRVDEHGVPLGLQGTFAGVGDLVQARRNGWELVGVEGNTRGPLNRETYRVTAVRDDGALEVTSDTTGAGEGETMLLPSNYVAEYLALGYASTVHAAQGATVDTTHSVVTSRTGPAAFYVGMSRGREANTAHVTTRTGPDDAAHGNSTDHGLHRDPVATVAAILETSEQAVTRSALTIAHDSSTEATSSKTAAELLADAAQLAAADRTATSLDQLAADGALTDEQRSRIAAEDGTGALTRILRRAELAGHDPHAVLAEAAGRGPLTGARNVSNVLYSRIQDTHRFEPVGQRWADWIPRTDDPEWTGYLSALATAADDRARTLGAELADEPQQWATDAFGPVPDDGPARDDWAAAAGRVAAYREARGHDDPTDALGPAPQPGQVEQFAAYRAAWRDLGRPDVDREHLELSNGQLRMRVRAYERELAAAPRYVANELAGTRQAAEHHRQDAALKRAEADTASDPAERERLITDADQATALAATLQQRASELQEVDDVRAHWLAHTSQTRLQHDLSKAELNSRDADDDPQDHITAADWKAAHDAAVAADERDRDVTENDIDPRDSFDVRIDEADKADTGLGRSSWRDLREEAAADPRQVDEDRVRVPDAGETTRSVKRAGRVLDEIAYRDSMNDPDDRAREEQLAHWHHDDRATEDAAADGDADVATRE